MLDDRGQNNVSLNPEETLKKVKLFFDSLKYVKDIRSSQDENPLFFHSQIQLVLDSLSDIFKNNSLDNTKNNINRLMDDFYKKYPNYSFTDTIEHFDELTQTLGYRHGYAEALRSALEKTMQENKVLLPVKKNEHKEDEKQPRQDDLDSPYAMNIMIDITAGDVQKASPNLNAKYGEKFRYYTWNEFEKYKDQILRELEPCRGQTRFYVMGHGHSGSSTLSQKQHGGEQVTSEKIAETLAPFLDGSPGETVSILGCQAANSRGPDLEKSVAYPCMNKLYDLIYARKKEESGQPPDITVRVTARTKTVIPGFKKEEPFRTIKDPFDSEIIERYKKIYSNYFAKEISESLMSSFKESISEHKQPQSKLVFIRNKAGIDVQDAYTREPYTSPISPALSNTQVFINKLKRYKKTREELQNVGFSTYSEIDLKFFKIDLGLSGAKKIAAVEKVIRALETNSPDPIHELDSKEIAALKQGDLGKLIKKNKKLLPPLLQNRLDETIFTHLFGKKKT